MERIKMQIVRNVVLLKRLFENLQSIAENKTFPTQQRVTAVGILSESAFHEYKNCDAIVNLAYSELISIIEDENENLSLRVEAIVIMLLLFQYYEKELPKDKRLIKDVTERLCLDKIQSFLQNQYNNTEGSLACISFLGEFRKDFLPDLSYEEISEKYTEKLLSISYNKNLKITNRISAISLLLKPMYKHLWEKYPPKELERKMHTIGSCTNPQFRKTVLECFDILFEIANDKISNALDRMKALEVISTRFYLKLLTNS